MKMIRITVGEDCQRFVLSNKKAGYSIDTYGLLIKCTGSDVLDVILN